MPSPPDVVITGFGVVCPIGIGKARVWQSLADGRSGVGPLPEFAGTDMPFQFGGRLADFDPKEHVVPRKSLKVMCREIQTGFAAAAQAVSDAGLISGSSIDPERLGVVFGTETFYGDPAEFNSLYRRCLDNGQFHPEQWGPGAMSELNPLWMLKFLPNMVACHIAIGLDARGPNNTIALEEASSLLAIWEAAQILRRGGADAMIAGGTGSLISLTKMVFRGDRHLSHRADEPSRASRPFDAARDGMVNGEGAAAFLLETRPHAEARGAAILARLCGASSAFAAPGPVPRSGDAIRRSIRLALRNAGWEPRQVGHVNAHGTSTIDDDAVEALAIHDELRDVPVTAPKSFFGNLGAGTGAVELAATLLGFAHDTVPFTLNYDRPDVRCPIDVVSRPLAGRDRTALLLNQSPMGHAVALAVSAN